MPVGTISADAAVQTVGPAAAEGAAGSAEGTSACADVAERTMRWADGAVPLGEKAGTNSAAPTLSCADEGGYWADVAWSSWADVVRSS